MQKVLYILGQMDDEDVEWLIRNGQRQFVPKGTTLIKEGAPVENFYILLDGSCSVSSYITANKEFAHHTVGEVIGEMSFIDSRPPSATVRVTEDATLLAIPRSELNLKLQRDPGFAARFYRAMSIFLTERLRTTVTLLKDTKEAARATAELPRIESADELGDNVLDNVSLAGMRFKRMLDVVSQGQ